MKSLNTDAYLNRQLDNYLSSLEGPRCKNSGDEISHSLDYYLFEDFATVEDYLEYNDNSVESIYEVLETVDQCRHENVVSFVVDEINIENLFFDNRKKLLEYTVTFSSKEALKIETLEEYFKFLNS